MLGLQAPEAPFEAVQPRVPALRVTQSRELTPGMHEDLEGLVVAAPCRLDEIALHRSLRLPARPS